MSFTALAERGLYIDGTWAQPVSAARDDVVNPATGQTFASVAVGGKDEATAAVEAARHAFDAGSWPRMSMAARVSMLRAWVAEIRARAPDLADLAVLEAGATRALAERLHVGLGLVHAERAFELALGSWSEPRVLGPFLTPGAAGTTLGTQIIVREPVGVVVAITPFNVPTFVALSKLAPALAVGNTVVLKPSPYTPLSALVLAECAEAAGLPAGVLNVITGGVEVGELLTSSPQVDMVSFTGSTAVGSRVMAQAAPNITRVHLELGGKSALIVRADADVAGAAKFGITQITTQAGQACAVCTRHLVHRSIHDDYVAALSAAAGAIVVGDPGETATQMGPLIRPSQLAVVERMVDEAVARGATVAAGGARIEGGGWFYPPTILTGVGNDWEIAQEEVFGPVAVVIPFDTDDEAVELANASRYGLSGAVWSRDVGAAHQLALRVRTGQLGINGGAGTTPADGPFGGYKHSGLGRERGTWGLDEVTEVKTISLHGA